MSITALGLTGGPAAGEVTRDYMSQMEFTLQLAGPRSRDFAPRLPTQECHVDDRGVRVVVDVVDSEGEPVNLRESTSIAIRCLKPDGTTYDARAQLLTNGMDGKCYFLSDADAPPFDQAGVWWVQAAVTLGDVGPQSTRWGKFAVESNIDLQD